MSGVLQGFLLGMAVIFEMRERKKRRDGKDSLDGGSNGHSIEEGGDEDERTALLRNER